MKEKYNEIELRYQIVNKLLNRTISKKFMVPITVRLNSQRFFANRVTLHYYKHAYEVVRIKTKTPLLDEQVATLYFIVREYLNLILKMVETDGNYRGVNTVIFNFV